MDVLRELWDWLTRFGELWLLGAVVAAGLAWILMDMLLGFADDRVMGKSTVRLVVRRKMKPTLLLWFVLRRGLPFGTGLLVFFLFLR